MSEISLFGEVDRYSGFHKFHSCIVLCREVSRCELFAKIQALPLQLDIALFQPVL